MNTSFLTRHPGMRDALNFSVFVIFVLVGTLIINSFIFRSFNVDGPSMEQTMYTGDRLIVNRLPLTLSQAQNKPYIPDRGQVIVFKNPRYTAGTGEEYIVKRVIAFAGERVVVKDGSITVYNDERPNGFDPDDSATHGTPGSPTSGEDDTIVAEGTLYVAGDHREGDFSYDSRKGMGTIPYYDIVGPVALRIWPLTSISTF